ncbi:hypothetical protein KC460_03215 [Candidatus Dependentiae bacterium]|nr:hypothetical protein [Candidatus Dependentiae bacterium]
MNVKNIVTLVIVVVLTSHVHAMNFLRPYDSLLRVDYTGKRWQMGFFAEGGLHASYNFDVDSNRTNVLRLYECDQNVLAALKGYDENTLLGQLNIRLNANDDGVRGHFIPTGCFKTAFGGAFAATIFITESFAFSLYLPFFDMRLENVLWCEQTKDITEDDIRVKENITNNFFENVKTFGDGLELGSWERRGFGDLLALLHWHKVYPQYRPLLKSAQLNGRIGLNLPSGRRKDEDKIMALSFGYDGAVGLLFGGGLDLLMGHYFKLGFDVELLHLFGNTRERRIKTHASQTELLLLKKACAYKDFGLTQRFNLYLQVYHFFKGASLLVGYQYFKHGDDELSLSTHEFSSEIANTSKILEEWTMHQIFVNASYNFAHLFDVDARVIPQASLFFRFPFNGKLSVLVPTVGGRISVDF